MTAVFINREIYTTGGVKLVPGNMVYMSNVALNSNGQIQITLTSGLGATISSGTIILQPWESYPFIMDDNTNTYPQGESNIPEFNTMSIKNAGYNPKVTVTTGGRPTTSSK